MPPPSKKPQIDRKVTYDTVIRQQYQHIEMVAHVTDGRVDRYEFNLTDPDDDRAGTVLTPDQFDEFLIAAGRLSELAAVEVKRQKGTQ